MNNHHRLIRALLAEIRLLRLQARSARERANKLRWQHQDAEYERDRLNDRVRAGTEDRERALRELQTARRDGDNYRQEAAIRRLRYLS